MLKTFRFPNKLLSLDYTKDFVLIGDNKGFVYKFKDSTISKLFFCDSPISSIQIHNEDIFYTTWDGDIYKNTDKLNLSIGIIKAMIISDNLIYVSLDSNVYILDLDLKILKVLDVPHKVLCFCSVNGFIVCGLNLPMLAVIDKDFNFTIKNVKHDTAVLIVKQVKDKILTGSVDGSVQECTISDVLYTDELVTNKIVTGNKWVRDIFDNTLFTRGNEVFYNSKSIYEHADEVMRVIKFNECIVSIGLDCVMNIYTEEEIFDDELDEIAKLNALY